MSINYYRLAKDEALPDEFCAVRDVGGEPSEYVFYVPDDENARLREEIEAAKHDLSLFSSELVASKLENAKLRELCTNMLTVIDAKRRNPMVGCTEVCPCWTQGKCQTDISGPCWFERRLCELGVEVDDGQQRDV